jgi:flagellar biosynthesis GTPase FlhF
MSTATQDTTPPATAPADGLRESGATRIYRGRTVEELIPKIQAELGADAIVVRREKGLTGGIAGFFQRPFVEIEAKAGTPRVDLYDEDGAAPVLPPPLEQLPASPTSFEQPPASLAQPPASLEQLPASLAQLPASLEQPAPQPLRGAYASDSLAAFSGGDLAEQFRELTPTSLIERATRANGSAGSHPAQNGDPFAAALAEAEAAVLPAADTTPLVPATGHSNPSPSGSFAAGASTASQSAAPRGRARAQIEASLLGFGVGEPLVRELIETAAAHVLPLMPARSSLARAVQRTIAQRIPSIRPLPVGSATIAVVGPGGSGKTACCAALLDAYRERSTLPAACATVLTGEASGELRALLSPAVLEPAPIAAPEVAQALGTARAEGLLLLDLPALSPSDRASIKAVAALLRSLEPDRVVVALPATLGAKPVAQLLEALRPLGASALAITHADETDQLGVAVEAACAFEIAPEYLVDRGRGRGGLSQIDAAYLAEKLLP